MTVQRARELLGLDDLTDEQVEDYIVQSKAICKSMLHVIVKDHSKELIDSKQELMTS